MKATHEGILKIGDTEIEVAVLENGKRIITQSGIFKALNRPVRGTTRIDQIPTFMDAKNLQPFINEELRHVINKVEFLTIDNKNGEGYDASILPLIADLYLQARASDSLLKSQFETAIKAEILVRSLAKVGITALVDEATGYQYEREQEELQLILKQYISEELLPWQQRFPHEFYRQIFRLNKWEYTVDNLKKRPSVVGTWTNKYIYKQLPNGVLDELKKITPKDSKGKNKEHFHRRLTEDVGHPNLNNQIVTVITIMKLSKSWKDFDKKFNDLFGQISIEFEEE
ncbi:P63C domain-containing protein [Wenyingzhuangia sp. chi5]|uniref:P63C domain-containing protein n=1 Tax=Wenyingzhuangia gilva TaxID=3057677 RepID=A0ABT8VVP9_9FLAO|nr:P63C domain-containing protein [Wenyingzhuangia sp. chi5]MDO3696052.1 P63C domain-containing protein [Wenyingzhuangia sp. chi5]